MSDKLGPFTFVNSILKTKTDLLTGHPERVSEYNSFITGRALSFYPDTVLLAQQVNQRPHITPEMHYRFLMATVDGSNYRQFTKWPKEEDHPMVGDIAKYYECSLREARRLVEQHTEEQLEAIRKFCDVGGRA